MVQAVKDGSPLRVGVVGVGTMGSNHARVLAGLSGVKLVGVADPDQAQRDLVTRALGCSAVTDLEALLKFGVDAVTIAAPTHLHRELALTCIQRGIHVLVEKPIASTVEQGHDIIQAARRAGVTLMVGHVERFNPAVLAIKEAIRGEHILSIAITRVGPFPPRMSNVGVVIDLAVHDIDLIRWFTESEIIEVQPQLSNAVAEREDIALLQFRTASGVLAHINTNWLTPFKARNVTIATRDKYLMGDLLTRQVTECFGFQADGSYSMRHLSVGHDEPLRAELIAFLEAVAPAQRAAGHRGAGGGEPRNCHPLPRGAFRGERGDGPSEGAAAHCGCLSAGGVRRAAGVGVVFSDPFPARAGSLGIQFTWNCDLARDLALWPSTQTNYCRKISSFRKLRLTLKPCIPEIVSKCWSIVLMQ